MPILEMLALICIHLRILNYCLEHIIFSITDSHLNFPKAMRQLLKIRVVFQKRDCIQWVGYTMPDIGENIILILLIFQIKLIHSKKETRLANSLFTLL